MSRFINVGRAGAAFARAWFVKAPITLLATLCMLFATTAAEAYPAVSNATYRIAYAYRDAFSTQLAACQDIAEYWTSTSGSNNQQYRVISATNGCALERSTNGGEFTYWSNLSFSCPGPNGGKLSGSNCACKPFSQDDTGSACVTAKKLVVADKSSPQSCRRPDGVQAGNPIIPFTGEKVLTETDFVDTGPHPLSFTRYYKSSWLNGGGRGLIVDPRLGPAWAHNHAVSLLFDGAPGTTNSSAGVVLGDGTTIGFGWDDASSSWKPDNGADSLVPGTGGLLFKRESDDSAFQFDEEGKLLSIAQRNGWKTTYTYSTASTPASIAQRPNRLIAVTNQFGRTINFKYDHDTFYSAIAPNGQVFTIWTDEVGRLRDTLVPGTNEEVKRTYKYENSTFGRAITGIVDEAGNRLSTYSYDAQGRGVSTQLAGGANLYTVNYPATEGSPTVVIDPLGTSRSYSYATQFGKLSVTGTDKPAGADEGDAASRVQNASGLIDSETDFLGVQTMYTWDLNRRLPLSTVKAAGRPEAQTISTQWHATFRLPVLITEAGRSTAYTYDTDGNKLTESITDIATSQVRTSAWSYIASGVTKGLVASMTDPKGGVWSYTYDAQGNRTSVTNPLSQVAQYSYDTAGRLATETAPNGLVTTYGYDVRSRVISASTGSGAQAELTTYSYNIIGKLAGMVLPSGYSASYSYDAAHRLIGATDNRGNSVAYTLDAIGNRTREEIKDAGNTLALATGRVINNLNRVQAIQGASGQSTTLGYDANGEAISQTDPLNQSTAQTLDGLRRPTATTFADNASAGQSWNALDQLTQVTDPKGIATQYQRNAFGEVMSEASPDAGTTTYQRNLAGEVIGQFDAKGNTTSITRDALGRPLVVTRTSPAGTATPNITSYTWDSGGLLSTGSQIGYLAKVEDKSGMRSAGS